MVPSRSNAAGALARPPPSCFRRAALPLVLRTLCFPLARTAELIKKTLPHIDVKIRTGDNNRWNSSCARSAKARHKRTVHKAEERWVDILNVLCLWRPLFDTHCEAFQECRLFIADYSTAPELNSHYEHRPALRIRAGPVNETDRRNRALQSY